MSNTDKYKPTTGETAEMVELEELVRAQNKVRAEAKSKKNEAKDADRS